MLVTKKQHVLGPRDLESDVKIGKNLQKMLFPKTPFVRFVGRNNNSSFGVIVEYDTESSYPNYELIVCVPKIFSDEFMQLDNRSRDVRKIITKITKLNRISQLFSQDSPSITFTEEYFLYIDPKAKCVSWENDPYSFIRVCGNKEATFSMYDFATAPENMHAVLMPMFLTASFENFSGNVKTYLSVGSDYIRSVDSQSFCIGSTKVNNTISLGSLVFDQHATVHGMIVEMSGEKFARCVPMKHIQQSFKSLYEVRLKKSA